MSHARHSWEAVGPFVAVESSVDDSASDVGSARSLCSSDDEHIAEPTPGDELVGFCKVLLWSRTLNAREFCTIMYWAGKAGVAEAVPLGYNPDAASGNFARRLRATQSTLGVIGAPRASLHRARAWSLEDTARPSRKRSIGAVARVARCRSIRAAHALPAKGLVVARALHSKLYHGMPTRCSRKSLAPTRRGAW